MIISFLGSVDTHGFGLSIPYSYYLINFTDGSLSSPLIMSTPTPLQSFLGGLALVIPVQILLSFNGQPFGISGFLRNATRGKSDALASVAGLLIGGLVVGRIERVPPEIIAVQLPRIAMSGLLVGVGTTVSYL